MAICVCVLESQNYKLYNALPVHSGPHRQQRGPGGLCLALQVISPKVF